MNKDKTLWDGFKAFIDNCLTKDKKKFKYIDACRYIERVYIQHVDRDSDLSIAIENIHHTSTLRNYIRYALKLGYLSRSTRGIYNIDYSIGENTITDLKLKIQRDKIHNSFLSS